MLRFLAPATIGIEITSTAVRFGVVGWKGGLPVVRTSGTVDLPEGMVTESYAPPVLLDKEQFSGLLRSSFEGGSFSGLRRIGLSLPDAMFRVQTLEFDEFPRSGPDQEKLIRWRLEKGAAFDMSDTVLRYQVRARPGRGHLVLAAVAKRVTIEVFEEMFSEMGFEVWTLLPSSFSVLNFYASYLGARSATYALAWLSGGSYSTLIVDNGLPRFYRYREIKVSTREEVTERLVRELDDSLHFFMHRDRDQQSEIGHLYVAGAPGMINTLSEALSSGTTMNIEGLSPRAAVSSLDDGQEMLAAAFGAGGMG